VNRAFAASAFLFAALAHADAVDGSAAGGTSRFGSADPRRAQVCVNVGDRAITVGEIEDRMAQVPAFQLKTFGNSDAEIRKAFVEQVIVPEALWAQGAKARHMETQVPTRFDLDRARAQATLRALKARLGPPQNVSMEDVQAYYDKKKARYDAPERYQIWRISCATKEEAQTVIADAKKDSTPPHWNKLARDHSLDKATYLRGGNVGFVALDGTSNETGLKIEPSVAKAASMVKDGEIVSEPVAEGSGFAVVWRRGTVGASHRSVAEVKDQIQWTILRDREEDEKKKLLAELRAKNLKEVNPEILTGIEVAPPDGVIVPRKRPGQVAPNASR
jgi:peptidyl-prolyl cis-trans isomerase C